MTPTITFESAYMYMYLLCHVNTIDEHPMSIQFDSLRVHIESTTQWASCEHAYALRLCFLVKAWFIHLGTRCKDSKSSKEQPGHSELLKLWTDSRIYATGQAATQVKTWKQGCRRLAVHLFICCSVAATEGMAALPNCIASPCANCTTNPLVYSAKFIIWTSYCLISLLLLLTLLIVSAEQSYM